MSTVTRPDAADAATARTLAAMVRVMFPHPSFPDGPYERTAAAILTAAADDLRFRAQLDQGLRDLDAAGGAPFADLEAGAALEVLRGMSSTEFFEGVRSRVITSLYDDREVWSLLGYEGPSFDQGGYLKRGFDDLDWLPDPRIEEAS
ncbi:MAG TPA: hypothetical protein VLA98_06130 [Solirubrobacteraceae bacterium]|nr:hypothetical protein [Solirubrobacteraceae bacterium]HSD80519.1 hypothetical protein [Solirubrobacteraceae bacterium]